MSEILAPAGSKNSALAAINAGADAIYLGLESFSARNSAENFGADGFAEISRYARAFGVKTYVAMNTAVKNCELDEFIQTAARVWNEGADALIVQDLYLGKFLKSIFPQMILHLSTQAGVCNSLGAELAKDFGFDRVILARETKLCDIEKISAIIETETFVQGALCTCFSGQCYMSSFAGGNSGNRGRCKQPCRKRYSIDREGFQTPAYRLSLSDLCVGENIDALIDAGVSSFKIEGRMRRPEYVSAAVSYYKNILSGRAADVGALKRTYNRGNYTKGLAFGQGKGFISSDVQGHMGEFVGVIKVENAKYICQSSQKFNRGDGFKILRGGLEVGGGAFGAEVKGGFTVNTRDRLKNGDKVFVTTDTALNERLLQKTRLIPVKVNAEFIAGKPARAEINGEVFTDTQPLEKALKRPLTEEEIARCFDKVDGYPFSVETEVKTDGVFAAASVMNAFRRKVYSDYFSAISKSGNKPVLADYILPRTETGRNLKTAVISADLNGVTADIGILKPNDYVETAREPDKYIHKLTNSFGGEKFLYVPPYLTDAEIETVSSVAQDFDGIYCDSYYGQKLAQKLGKKFFAGTGLNLTNAVALQNCSADYKCLSKELTVAEARELAGENVFYLAGGNIKVMDLIYCPFEKKCASCDKRSLYTLTDGDGRKFPLRRYKTSECRFEVYNCADLQTDGVDGGFYDRTLKNTDNARTRGHSVTGIY